MSRSVMTPVYGIRVIKMYKVSRFVKNAHKTVHVIFAVIQN